MRDAAVVRLTTTAWFAVGCALAVSTLAGGRFVMDALQGQAHGTDATVVHEADATSSVMTPALAPTPEVAPQADPWAEVPVQRPKQVRSPVAPVPAATRVGEARLSNVEGTVLWNPDDPRMPDESSLALAMAALPWNPDSATLPRPTRIAEPVAWNPDDPRLPRL